MSAYTPPTENLSVFNSSLFSQSASDYISQSYADTHYIQYATSQSGTINIAGILTNTNSSSNQIYGYGSSILGTNNTGYGYAALQNNTATGLANTAIGYNSLLANTTGDFNVSLGGGAGVTNTTGSNNTYLGRAADANAATYSNSTAVGSNATITASNQIMLGTLTETVTIPRTIRYVNSPCIIRKAAGSQTVAANGNNIILLLPTSTFDGGYTGITYSAGTFTNSNSYTVTAQVCLNIYKTQTGSGTLNVIINSSTYGNLTYTELAISGGGGFNVSLAFPIPASGTFTFRIANYSTSTTLTINNETSCSLTVLA